MSACSRTLIICASDQATTYTMTPRSIATLGVVKESSWEWNDDLLPSVMRVDSICIRMMDIHMYSIDLVRVIFRSAFSHDKQAPLQASWCRGCHQLQLVTLVFLQGKVNSAPYIAQVVNPLLLPFLRQVGDVLFEQDNTCPHTAVAMQRAFHGVQQLP